MKAILLLFVLLFVGCTMEFPELGYIPERDFMDSDITSYLSCEEGKMSGPEFISMWVRTNIRYCSDIDQHGISEYWQTPELTYVSRIGDCEDSAILFMHFMKVYYGLYFDMWLVYSGAIQNHFIAVGEFEGEKFYFGIYEGLPEWENPESILPIETYSYYDALWIAQIN